MQVLVGQRNVEVVKASGFKKIWKSSWMAASLVGLIACGSAEQSDIKVTNGKSITESEHPSVVLLVMFSDLGQSICTGTFVAHDTLITAGHCVDGLDPKAPRMAYAKLVKGADGKESFSLGGRATSYVRNPQYSMDDNNGVNGNDLAVVKFPKNTAPAVSVVAKAAPALEAELTIVGYGNNSTFIDEATGQMSGDGSGVKRVGTNKVRALEEGMIVFYGFLSSEVEDLELGTWVSSGSGDSGGPLFVDGKLAGVTSGGGMAKLKSGEYIGVSRYVDLNSAVSAEFLSKNM